MSNQYERRGSVSLTDYITPDISGCLEMKTNYDVACVSFQGISTVHEKLNEYIDIFIPNTELKTKGLIPFGNCEYRCGKNIITYRNDKWQAYFNDLEPIFVIATYMYDPLHIE